MGLSELQLAERQQGLGGSDAAPALGLSPWKSPLELYLEKREQTPIPAPDSAAQRWGLLLEPVIRQAYAERTGRVVRLPSGTLRHPAHPWMLAHVDGVTDDGRVVEIKTARFGEGWGSRESEDDVPYHYLLQVQHYLAVTGFKIADIAVLIGGNDFRVYHVPADTELQTLVIDGERSFWDLVEQGAAPEPAWEGADVCKILERLYPGTDGRTLYATSAQTKWRSIYEEARQHAESYQQAAEGAKAHLLHEMGTATRLLFDDGMQLRRRIVQRKAYSVAPGSYIDARFTKVKEEKA